MCVSVCWPPSKAASWKAASTCMLEFTHAANNTHTPCANTYANVHTYTQEKFGVFLSVLASFKGSVLEGCLYKHPLYDRQSPLVVGGDYITTDAGTGLVHTAPGHGQEDYQVCVCVCMCACVCVCVCVCTCACVCFGLRCACVRVCMCACVLVYCVQDWPGPCIHTVYNRIFGSFPATNTISHNGVCCHKHIAHNGVCCHKHIAHNGECCHKHCFTQWTTMLSSCKF